MKIFWAVLVGLFMSTSVLAANWRPVDNRAMNVPRTYDDNLPALVRYLVEPYAQDEEKKPA